MRVGSARQKLQPTIQTTQTTANKLDCNATVKANNDDDDDDDADDDDDDIAAADDDDKVDDGTRTNDTLSVVFANGATTVVSL
jgi:hypothetical protein